MASMTLMACSSVKQDRITEINGTRFHFLAYGHGSPTVLFENGMASSLDTWGSIPDSISKTTKVFAYDRAGIGRSDTISAERSIPNMVNELRDILKKEHVRPPYIYVAHSMGSYLARYFAAHYPDEIQAILLIDPSPDKMYDDYNEQEYREFKEFGDQSFLDASIGPKSEWENYLDNRRYVRDAVISDRIPMVIISATQWDFYDYHEGMINGNPYSKHLKEEGGHDLHQEKPQLIIDLIHQLLERSN
jgi:pimeloyl-ACP methyl ester carboxylesterase